VIPGLHRQSGVGHGIDSDGATVARVSLSFSLFSLLALVFLVHDRSLGTREARTDRKIRRCSARRVFI
jgi:hypothetical protein